jgi:hypothetical protein
MALWVAVCALLLKAAVPLLASTAAQSRGVAVAEVCSVYGVSVAAGADAAVQLHHVGAEAGSGSHDPNSQDSATHAGDHCALTALAALAPPDVAPGMVQPAAHECALPSAQRFAALHDACADWVAQRKQGPPAFS